MKPGDWRDTIVGSVREIFGNIYITARAMSSIPNVTYPSPNSLYEDPLYTYRVGDYVTVTLTGTFAYETMLALACWDNGMLPASGTFLSSYKCQWLRREMH
jgi:hypothetical protein